PSADAVGVLSEGFWKRRVGGSSGVLGQVVQVNNTPITIIGVTPSQFTGIQQPIGTAPVLTVPLTLDARLDDSHRLAEATAWWLQVMGRLKPGVTATQVQASLD